jgi:hypothetical protein
MGRLPFDNSSDQNFLEDITNSIYTILYYR